MVELTSLISDEEKNLIDEYRKDFACENYDSGDHCTIANFCSTDHYLRFWEEQKRMLATLLGGKLIVKKPISYTAKPEDLEEESRINSVYLPMRSFIDKFRMKVTQFFSSDDSWNIKYSICNDSSIYSNRTTSSLDLTWHQNGEEKHFTANAHSKTSKIIGKLCTIMGLEGYEEFRILHSQLLNSGKMNGELCLSIHPLDYMTMSDNDNNWTSCMSWRDHGCYRQGTVEMMNSPYVVVAYIASSEPMRFYDKYWNSKKWRSLFVVHPDIITNVKSYPYSLPNIELEAVEWLKELAEKNCSFEYGYSKEYKYPNIGDGKSVAFWTDYMYNDFGADVQHFCVLGNRVEGNLDINYSGTHECVWCGGVSFDREAEEIEGSLLCDSCAPDSAIAYCDCCNEPIYEGDDYYEVNGRYVCSYCYDEHVVIDLASESEDYKDDLYQIVILPAAARGLTEKELDAVLSFNSSLFLVYTGDLELNSLYDGDLLKKGAKIHHWSSNRYYNTRYYAYSDDFTEFGKEIIWGLYKHYWSGWYRINPFKDNFSVIDKPDTYHHWVWEDDSAYIRLKDLMKTAQTDKG